MLPCQAEDLHESDVVGLPAILVIPCIDIFDRAGKLIDVVADIVESADCDGVKCSTELCLIAPCKGAHATDLAEAIVQVEFGAIWRDSAIVGQLVLACHDRNRIGPSPAEPRSRLGADGTVAALRAFREIKVSRERDSAAMAGTVIGFKGHA